MFILDVIDALMFSLTNIIQLIIMCLIVISRKQITEESFYLACHSANHEKLRNSDLFTIIRVLTKEM